MSFLLRAVAACLGLCLPAWAQEPTLHVAITRVALAPQPIELHLSGTIEAPSTTQASFKTAGRVLAIHADIGDTVAAGTLLAALDDSQQQQALRMARAALEAAEANLINATQNWQRAEALLTAGTLSQAQFDVAHETYLNAEAARHGALSDLDKAQQAVTDTLLIASRDALITARRIELGQVVGATEPAFTLSDISQRDAAFLVQETLPVEDLLGQVLRLTRLDAPDVTYEATIEEVFPVVDPQLGAIRLTARLNGTDTLPLGEAVRAQTEIGSALAIVLPWQALSATAQGPAVWRLTTENRAELVPVTIQRFTSDNVILTPDSALQNGDLIVTKGAHLLSPGRLVSPSEDVIP